MCACVCACISALHAGIVLQAAQGCPPTVWLSPIVCCPGDVPMHEAESGWCFFGSLGAGCTVFLLSNKKRPGAAQGVPGGNTSQG